MFATNPIDLTFGIIILIAMAVCIIPAIFVGLLPLISFIGWLWNTLGYPVYSAVRKHYRYWKWGRYIHEGSAPSASDSRTHTTQGI